MEFQLPSRLMLVLPSTFAICADDRVAANPATHISNSICRATSLMAPLRVWKKTVYVKAGNSNWNERQRRLNLERDPQYKRGVCQVIKRCERSRIRNAGAKQLAAVSPR